jgi:AraC-like DNA-binding protein
VSELVVGMTGVCEATSTPVARQQPASSLLALVISVGDPLHVTLGDGSTRAYHSFITGIMPEHVTTSFVGTQHCIQVYLTPVGAYRLLGIPGGELVGRVHDLDAVSPPLATLQARLEALTSWDDRFALAEQAFAHVRPRHATADPVVAWLWSRISAAGGQASISRLVNQTGWSHRHVAARFRHEVGISPKAAAGLLRFEHAAADLAGRELRDVAHTHGFADQSHLTREVRRYTGESPEVHRRAQRPTAHTALGLSPVQVAACGS